MILPDINVLLYAYNRDSRYHVKSAAWWTQCLSGSETVTLCGPVLFGFLRISTNTRALTHPISVAQATARIQEWLDLPVVQLAEMTIQDVRQALVLLDEAGTAGNLTTDAQIAAISLRLGAIVHTADADFGRFSGVRWHNPLIERRK